MVNYWGKGGFGAMSPDAQKTSYIAPRHKQQCGDSQWEGAWGVGRSGQREGVKWEHVQWCQQ